MAEDNKKGNVPNLRFPGFDGEWDESVLGNVCAMKAGKFIIASDIFEEFEEKLFPCYGGNGLRGYVSSYNKDGLFSLIGRQGALCGNVNLVSGKVYATEHAVVVSPEQNIDTIWLYHLLNYLNLNQYATGAAQPGLSVQNLEKVEVKIPKSKLEQVKISSFLYLLDQRIDTQSKIIEELKLLQNTTVNHVFTQKLKFKNSSNNDYPEWQTESLGGIGETYSGLTGKTKDDFGMGKPYIQYKQIFDQSKIDITRCELVKIKHDESQHLVKKGDIFFTVSSETPEEIGMSSVLLDEVEELYLNSFCFGYRPNAVETLLPSFARYLFRSDVIRNEIIKLAQGSTRYNMSKVALMKLKVILPTNEEQIKIGIFLTTLDDKISVEENLLEKLKKQKQYLLSNLFI